MTVSASDRLNRVTVNRIRDAVADVRAHRGGLPPMTQNVIGTFANVVKSNLSYPSRQTVGAPSLAPPKGRLLMTVLMTGCPFLLIPHLSG